MDLRRGYAIVAATWARQTGENSSSALCGRRAACAISLETPRQDSAPRAADVRSGRTLTCKPARFRRGKVWLARLDVVEVNPKMPMRVRWLRRPHDQRSYRQCEFTRLRKHARGLICLRIGQHRMVRTLAGIRRGCRRRDRNASRAALLLLDSTRCLTSGTAPFRGTRPLHRRAPCSDAASRLFRGYFGNMNCTCARICQFAPLSGWTTL